jgi:malonate-semialdehyde dehydrogenase (acetylating) / methylmalonate-semialdehyde dehydrogenase
MIQNRSHVGNPPPLGMKGSVHVTEMMQFIGGQPREAHGSRREIVDPASGKVIGAVRLALPSDVDDAVAAAVAAAPAWSAMGLQNRANLMLDMRDALAAIRDELSALIVAETGKTITDATAEVTRTLEVMAIAVNATTMYAAPYTRGVSSGVNTYEVRFPVGVVAAITPFNFPLNIPMVQSMMAMACGNTVVNKPSERNPSAVLRAARAFKEAGLPDGVFNVVLGDAAAVNRLIEHPDVPAITFVGSTPVARDIRIRGVANNKRVQAFGGGKNHMVVMPDADLELVADAAVSAAFGAAGQRCMAISVVVAVGDVADPLVEAIRARATTLEMGGVSSPSAQLGPVISSESLARITKYVAGAHAEGAEVVLDGRERKTEEGGWYIGPTLIDKVKPGMDVHKDEIFGPVLSIVRVATYEEAIEVISSHELGNGAAIFTQSGAIGERFTVDAPAGQIGINVPIPVPVFFHGFAGWKDSAFTETKLHGRDAIQFLTRSKTVSAKWLSGLPGGVSLHFPSSS